MASIAVSRTTRSSLALPSEQRPTPPAARRDDNSSNDDVTKMGHVLIVDDDPALRQMMTEYFVNPDHSASLGDSSSLSTWIRFSIHTGMDQVPLRREMAPFSDPKCSSLGSRQFAAPSPDLLQRPRLRNSRRASGNLRNSNVGVHPPAAPFGGHRQRLGHDHSGFDRVVFD
jgi:hypothetical protein